MENVMFFVNERPQVSWDWELSSKNLEFLKGVDADYYAHMVQAHAPYLEGDSKLEAAAALRIAHSQGLETLLALVCAMVQAPTCVVGWLQAYRNAELRSVVSGMGSLRPPYVHPAFSRPSWGALSGHVHSHLPYDEDKKVWIARGFGELWSRFAKDFLDDTSTQEYNALKHGSRPRLGGFSLSVGLQSAKGVPAPPDAMRSMGGSAFGSTFFVSERLSDAGLHSRLRRTSLNWVPENLVNGLSMLAMSIQNVTSFLRIINGELPEACRFDTPLEETAFGLPWAQHCGVTSSSLDSRVGADDVVLWTKEEVLEFLCHTDSPEEAFDRQD
jgi:hypothetical protein